ncbi:Tex family protein [Corynebacterium pseudotuberculosis]|uniref:S1 RNA-binding domain-containing protein n=1 Tax=Corynebacterium pseudotuberculosis (strain C231) TaxID=681645 RepID=D9QB63_CORP2|nr:Tex family protein [Corynebacterium pseudotuberculosis]ADL10789.1 S1 RNA-binding domain-containing protein [Corynebacterium pseudotuberculosis C231]ADO26588.1 S1 RNA-binding domain-containing protein [Corynebacterium pseudotuberculosis I19]AEK92652.1 Transcriptional accessory protein [Corynebacterium pseudotuberculosis PAT10]AFF22475.1 Transcriptional accessory protein [Corynebacterium pseudotuberculosis P54B96]AKI59679.1 RNA-binding transcriptional accessory protein [Corynebacterium pseudo
MISAKIAQELGVKESNVASALALLAEGNTVPFIARYRKEATGGLDDSQLRAIEERATYLRELEDRKQTILAAIEEQGKLDQKLKTLILECDTKARLEDLYLPYKKRRKTKADIAREAGLEQLLDKLIDAPHENPDQLASDFVTEGFEDVKKALEGAREILIDRFALNADLVGEVRERMFAAGSIIASPVEGKEAEGAKFKDYFEFSEPFTSLPSHRILALFRGEKEGVLHLNLDPGDESIYEGMIADHFGLDTSSPWFASAVRWGWKTKLVVSSGLDVRMRLKERAEEGALDVFARNLKDVLLAAPAGQRATLGLDPGYRNGVKCAVVDHTGKVLDTLIVYPHQPQNKWSESVQQLASACATHGVDLMAVGNGTASRETEKLAGEVADLIKKAGGNRPTPVVVSESGASVYSASELAAKEFPTMDVSLRGAVSIARRLQDPLAELVKIDPKAIGVGQYQHDVNQAALAKTLDAVVEDAVNAVGVDLNTASVPLLSRVAGISPTIAENIVQYRDEHGSFVSRASLKKVPRLGPKAFEQCAGFLRISGARDPLDSSAVHPEAYPVVRRIAEETGLSVDGLIGNTAVLKTLRPRDFADDHFGVPTVTDILAELDKPGRDPRPEFATATFKEGVEKISDLIPGMILEGTVTNVAAFGAFVDVGVHQDGLVHVSALAETFVSDPHYVVRSGQVVKVKVMDVDPERKRISLSMKLSDGPGAGAAKSASRNAKTSKDGRSSLGNSKRNTSQRRGPSQHSAGGAMAEALRRAGLK